MGRGVEPHRGYSALWSSPRFWALNKSAMERKRERERERERESERAGERYRGGEGSSPELFNKNAG